MSSLTEINCETVSNWKIVSDENSCVFLVGMTSQGLIHELIVDFKIEEKTIFVLTDKKRIFRLGKKNTGLSWLIALKYRANKRYKTLCRDGIISEPDFAVKEKPEPKYIILR